MSVEGNDPFMTLWHRHRDTTARYLIEVPHDPDECLWVMDEIVGRGPQYAEMFWWGCQVGDHRAWAVLDGVGREAVIEEALPPVLRDRAIAHRVARVTGPELRDRHDLVGDPIAAVSRRS